MAPKRKLADDDSTETTRPTRSSTRNKTAAAKGGSNEKTPKQPNSKRGTKATSTTTQAEVHHDIDEKQPAKRSRTTKNAKGRKQQKTTANIDDESGAAGQRKLDDEDQKVKQREPYTAQRALALFGSYAEQDEPDMIGPEGFERLCGDAGFSMEGPVPLLLAWQMEAKEMAKISKDEWIAGTTALRVSSPQQLSVALSDLESLLIHGKPPIKKPATEVYDRTKYWTYASDPKEAFHKFYQYCFVLVKPPSSKNIEMETATAFWSVLLGPKYPLMKEVLDFINEKGTYRAANKDLWNMILEFCETVNPNLDNFEADGAWPTLLDEFASWKQSTSET